MTAPSGTSGAGVEVRVLGPLELRVDGALADIGGPRQRALLALLVAQRGEVVRSRVLIDALWPDDDATNADGALRAYLSRLRKALRDAGAPATLLHTEAAGYRLDLSAAVVDAERLAHLANAAQQAAGAEDPATFDHAERALDWWRGEPYVEFADHPWAQAEIRRLRELHVAAREARATGLLILGRPAEAAADLERLVAAHPRRESFVANLALSLYRASRQSEALECLARYRRLLADEAGLAPGPTLSRLEHRILHHDPTLERPNPPGTPLRSYVLGGQLGEGAFAEVFEGTQPSVGRSVAVKVIRAELANRPEFVRRFEAEAHLVARLEHPHIVPLYDYWREPDRAFLVMRLLRGGTLEQALSAQGPLSLSAAATMAHQVGAALGAAHRAGVVHRDVKPANVFLDGEGNFYLGDFGIALGAAEAVDPESSLSAGSPAYAAPEQLRREPAGPAADIWGLGVTLYEALTGRLPFPDEHTQAGLFRRYTNDPLPAVRAARPDVPAAIDEVIARATAKDPTARWSDIDEMVAAFQAACGGSDAPLPRRSSVTATAIGGNERNPYKGLAAFTEADAADFFGRARLVDQLVGLLQRAGTAGRILAVVGPSGIGKSSVVRAGLLPALRSGAMAGSQQWFVASMLPGSDPFEELAPALLKVAVNPPPGDFAALLSADRRGLTRMVKAIVPEGSTLLLVIDQFEETFTLTGDDGMRRRFLDAIEHAVTDQRCPLRVVLTLRADFYDRPLRYGDFARLLRDSTVAVLPLAADELERAIIDPAARAGVEFEPGLLSRIVTDVADQPAALPILQYALTELYEQRVSGMLTVSAYERLGGVSGALAQRAEQLLEASGPQEASAARRLFGRLVTLGEGVEDTRRRVLRSEAGTDAATNAVIETFGAARLLSFDRDPLSREPTVEVAHEALIREWPRLRNWLDEDRDSLRAQRHLGDAAAAWAQRERDQGDLYRGGRLDSAIEWQASQVGELNELETEFLRESVALRERATLYPTPAAPGSPLAVSISPDESTLYVGAGTGSLAGSGEGTVAVYDIATGQQRSVFRVPHTAAVGSLLATPDGRRLISGGRDGSVVVWDLIRGEVAFAPFVGHRTLVLLTAVSSDGRYIATASTSPATVFVWDAVTGARVAGPFTTDGISAQLLFDDAGRLYVAGNGGPIDQWDVATSTKLASIHAQLQITGIALLRDRRELLVAGNRIARFAVDGTTSIGTLWPGATPTLVAWSPDPTRAATLDAQATATLVDASTGTPIAQAQVGVPLSGIVGNLVFDPTGSLLVVGRAGGIVERYDGRTGEPAGPPMHAPRLPLVFDLVFNRDGTRLAVTGPKWVVVFDVASGDIVGEYQVSEGQRSFPLATFSADGRRVIVGVAFEPVLLVFDPDTNAIVKERTLPWGMATGPVTVSRDGSNVLLGGIDGAIHILDGDLNDAEPPIEGVGGTIGTAQVQLLPDGRRLLAQRVDATQVLVDLTTGKTASPGFPHANPGPSYARSLVSPDGKRLATGNRAGGATIWDLDPDTWRRRACEIAGRNLTRSEWDRYLSQLGAYQQTCPERPPAP